MNDEINLEILNSFINLIIMDVAKKYIYKVKNEKRYPPQLIEEYLEKSFFLVKKYKTIKIPILKDTITDLNKEEQKKFNLLFEYNKEYQFLCQELNFAYLLIIDEDLQKKTLELIYDNIYEYNFFFENGKNITKKQVDISSVIKHSNPKNINKLHNYQDYNSSYAPL